MGQEMEVDNWHSADLRILQERPVNKETVFQALEGRGGFKQEAPWLGAGGGQAFNSRCERESLALE